MINLRWSIIAAAAAFCISLALGISVRGQMFIILLRALGFAVFFFFLAVLIWRLINRYIPDLLTDPPVQDAAAMMGAEAGSRVNITVGEDPIPRDVALPPEGPADDSVGNITEMMSSPSSPQGAGVSPSEAPGPGGPPLQAESLPVPAALVSTPATPALTSVPAPPAPVFSTPVPAASQGMDQGSQSGYTQNGNVVSGASPAPLPAARGSSGAPGLGDISGGVESLPDLDALAGTFLSSDAAGGEEAASSSRPYSGGGARSKKGKDMGEDFNPKELASAIQTILKRD